MRVRESLPSEITEFLDLDFIGLALVEVGQTLLIDLGGDGGGRPEDVLEPGGRTESCCAGKTLECVLLAFVLSPLTFTTFLPSL